MPFKSLSTSTKSWLKTLLRARNYYSDTQKKELKEAFGLFEVSNMLEKWLTDDKIEDFEKAIAYLPAYYPNQISYSHQKNYPFTDENDAHFLQKMGAYLSQKYRNQTLLGILAEIKQRHNISEK